MAVKDKKTTKLYYTQLKELKPVITYGLYGLAILVVCFSVIEHKKIFPDKLQMGIAKLPKPLNMVKLNEDYSLKRLNATIDTIKGTNTQYESLSKTYKEKQENIQILSRAVDMELSKRNELGLVRSNSKEILKYQAYITDIANAYQVDTRTYLVNNVGELPPELSEGETTQATNENTKDELEKFVTMQSNDYKVLYIEGRTKHDNLSFKNFLNELYTFELYYIPEFHIESELDYLTFKFYAEFGEPPVDAVPVDGTVPTETTPMPTETTPVSN